MNILKYFTLMLFLHFTTDFVNAQSIPDISDNKRQVTVVNVSDATSPTAQLAVRAEGQFTTEPIRIIVSLWADGTIIWSENQTSGGVPYLRGNIEPDKVLELTNRLKNLNRPDNLSGSILIIPDASYQTLYVSHDSQPIYLRSAFAGIKLEHYKEITASDEFRKFTGYWNEVKEILFSAIPQTGEPVSDIDLLTEVYDTKTGEKRFSKKPTLPVEVQKALQ